MRAVLISVAMIGCLRPEGPGGPAGDGDTTPIDTGTFPQDRNTVAYCGELEEQANNVVFQRRTGRWNYLHEILALEIDEDADGTVERTLQTRFDNDLRVTDETTLDSDATPVRVVHTETNEITGLLEIRTRDEDADGTPEASLLPVRFSQGGDAAELVEDLGEVQNRWTYAYAADRQPSLRQIDLGDDEEIDRTTTWVYVPRVDRREVDADADGTPDQVVEQEVDERGRLITVRTDAPYDDEWDSFVFHTYDDADRVSRTETEIDGKIVSTTTFSYDERDRLRTQIVSSDSGETRTDARYFRCPETSGDDDA